jgi:mRNA interferase RelE/StbE
VYAVLLSRRAQKDLRNLGAAQRNRLVAHIEALADDPFPPGRKKLKGQRGDYWRVRVGDFRILYEVNQGELVVLVLRALDRKEAY